MLEVSPLLPSHRGAVGLHLLSLSPDDRYDRFGMAMKDEALLGWTSGIDWKTQRWWGAWLPQDVGLIGALQLSPSRRPGAWELAMTVSEPIRRQGVGSRLLSTAVAQSPEVSDLICQHGHAAIHVMAKRLGYRITVHSNVPRLQVHTDGFKSDVCRYLHEEDLMPRVSASSPVNDGTW